MKFGKYLAKRHLDSPEYAQYFLDYKASKKSMKRLAALPAADNSEAARHARSQQNKSTFFFQLERELEKATKFYTQKEAELESRLEQSIQRKRAMASGSLGKITRSSVAYISVHEGSQRYRRDSDRLEQFVELNATGFAKVSKKWDKQSRSQTKELYLSRAVEVQPMFNRDILAKLNDRSNACLLEVEASAQGDSVVFETVKETTPGMIQAAEASDDMFNEFIRFACEYNASDIQAKAAMDAWIQESINSSHESQTHSAAFPAHALPLPAASAVHSQATTVGHEPETEGPSGEKSGVQSGEKSEAVLETKDIKETSVIASASEVQITPTNGVTQVFLRSISSSASDDAVMASWNSGHVDIDAVDEVASRTVSHLCANYTASSPEQVANRIGQLGLVTKSITRVQIFRAVLDATGSRSVNRVDANGYTPLICAAIHNRQEFSVDLSRAGADTNVCDNDNLTASHYSIFHGFLRCMEESLDAGAQTAGSDTERQYVPSNFGCQHGASKAIESSSKKRPHDPIVADAEGSFPLHIVARAGYANIVPLSCKAGSSVNQVDKSNGWTPSMYAASEGHYMTVEASLENNADYSISDERGRTAMFYAAWEGHPSCFRTLKAARGSSQRDISVTGQENVPESGSFQRMHMTTTSKSRENESRTPSIAESNTMEACLESTSANAETANAGPSDAEDSDVDIDTEASDEHGEASSKAPGLGDATVGEDELEIDDIPDLESPPPIMPLKRYGHNFLDAKKVIVQIRDIQVQFDKDRRGLRASSLTITTSSTRDSIPRNLPLPVPVPDHVQTFEVDHLDKLSSTFEVMPTFGTRLSAKAVAGSHFFGVGGDEEPGRHHRTVQVTMIDLMLRPVGTIEFAFLIVKPFPGRVLDITKYDTYWKSTAQQQQEVTTSSYVTASSLHGTYERKTVTSTRDLVPVSMDMKFQLAENVWVATPSFTSAESRQSCKVMTSQEWWQMQQESSSNGSANSFVNIHVPFPTIVESRDVPVRWPATNVYVDCISDVVFEHARQAQSRARGLVFSSTHPDICAMFNWKQPNYPVSFCATAMRADGSYTTANRIETSETSSGESPVCKSLREASIFASTNNLMGILAPADVSRLVPAVVPAIRAMGLVLIAGETGSDTQVEGCDGFQTGSLVEFSRDIGV